MNLSKLFEKHLEVKRKNTDKILEKLNYDGLIIASGSSKNYFLDDLSVPFVPNPHFSHCCPLRSANHFIIYTLENKPKLFYHQSKDFWHETDSLSENFWQEGFTVYPYEKKDALLKELRGLKNFAFLGEEAEDSHPDYQEIISQFDHNPENLLHELNWQRAVKSDYEINCLKTANEKAARAHQAVEKAFYEGASELELHYLYLRKLEILEKDLPYPSIIAQNEKSAILHYQKKRKMKNSKTLLIDAGFQEYGYAADISRTYLQKNSKETLFASLLAEMTVLQKKLCQKVKEGVSFFDLNKETHLKIAQILLDAEILQDCSKEEALKKNLSQTFFPHGLGHMLGLQVHDVGGMQKNAQGESCEASKEYPSLRASRPLRENEVITIEPGLYFIPLLLEKAFTSKDQKHYNQSLCQKLIPLGGIRIEDNIVVKKEKSLNLTRTYLD